MYDNNKLVKSGHILESKSILKSSAIIRLFVTVVLILYILVSILFRLVSKEDISTMKFIMMVYIFQKAL